LLVRSHSSYDTACHHQRGSELILKQENIMVRTAALITGASTGIGAAYAERLAQRGHDLILVARDASKLHQVASGIGEMTGVAIDVLPADLTSDSDRAFVERRLCEDLRILILVNNAGASSNTTILKADPDRLEGLIDLNVVALTRLSVAIAPSSRPVNPTKPCPLFKGRQHIHLSIRTGGDGRRQCRNTSQPTRARGATMPRVNDAMREIMMGHPTARHG
jgi:NAD(P)-dependent dehydrogenase (short-subunit alcohol dehydrogenase family)